MPDYNNTNHAWLMPEVYDGKPIPELTRSSLAKYVLYGAPVGSFLDGLLTNDLRIAVGAAERVTAWQSSGGMVGREWIEDPKYTGASVAITEVL